MLELEPKAERQSKETEKQSKRIGGLRGFVSSIEAGVHRIAEEVRQIARRIKAHFARKRKERKAKQIGRKAYTRSVIANFNHGVKADKYKFMNNQPKRKPTYQQFKKKLNSLTDDEPAFNAFQRKYPKYAKKHGKELAKSMAKTHKQQEHKHEPRFTKSEQNNIHHKPDDGPDWT